MILKNYLRKLFLKLFFKINPGDILIKHHWVKLPIKLHSFKHKGYWWYGKRREKDTILSFFEVVPKGGGVIEIGGHIGYFTLLFSHLVGNTGRIWVFEPGSNNLFYIKKNIAQLKNITLIEKAVSDNEGEIKFYTENLTGQNNSILSDYSVYDKNLLNSGVKDIQRQIEVVESTTLDAFWLKKACPKIDFIKIDVEGAELNVLRGGNKLLSELKPVLMVEVTREKEAVFKLMQDTGYNMCSPEGQVIEKASQISGNVFFFPSISDRETFLVKRKKYPRHS